MKKLYPLLSVLFLIYWGCEGTTKEYDFENIIYNQKTDTYSVKFSDEVPNGILYEMKYGEKFIIGSVKNGVKHGLWNIWWDNGDNYRLLVEKHYKNGKLHGKYISWYENGKKEWEGIYKDGKEISKKEWNEDGSLKE